MPYALPDAIFVHPITLPVGHTHLSTVCLRIDITHKTWKSMRIGHS